MHVHPRFIERRGSSARVRGVEWGGARANTSTIYMTLHKEAEMDTVRKNSETSVKKHFTKMLKDVGMVVPKIKETR